MHCTQCPQTLGQFNLLYQSFSSTRMVRNGKTIRRREWSVEGSTAYNNEHSRNKFTFTPVSDYEQVASTFRETLPTP